MLAEISPVYQTCKLLQMNKTDAKAVMRICPSLNPKQVWIGDENDMGGGVMRGRWEIKGQKCG